jgi:lipopolysaccharide export system protein LptC
MAPANPNPSLAPAPTSVRPGHSPKPWRLQQRATAFLPVIFMGLLATGTWWLVKNSLQPEQTQISPVKKHEPDYEMRNFSVQRHQIEGKTTSHLEGQLLRHYPDTDTLEIDQARIRSTSPDGSTTLAIAHKAVAQSDGKEVELFGNAQVTRTPPNPSDNPIYFKSNYLRALVQEERITSNQPVTIQHGNTWVQASGIDYTHSNGTIIFSGRTRASFTPPGTK